MHSSVQYNSIGSAVWYILLSYALGFVDKQFIQGYIIVSTLVCGFRKLCAPFASPMSMLRSLGILSESLRLW